MSQLDIRYKNKHMTETNLEDSSSNERIAEFFQTDYYEKVHNDHEKTHRARNALILDIIGVAIVVVCVIVLSQFYTLKIVYEQSMDNTIKHWDCIMIAKTEYSFSQVEYGDIIVVTSAIADDKGGTQGLIRRVVGRPGDTIEIKGGSILRNGRRLIENYTKDGGTYGQMSQITIPAGSYFVMGDNRQDSIDSRDARVGFVNDSQIVGKVIYRILPLSKAGSVYDA